VPESPIPEHPSLTLKKYEELYRFSEQAYIQQRDRFERAEEKLTRYSTFLIVIIGAATLPLETVIEKAQSGRLFGVIFFALYSLAYGSAWIAMLFAFKGIAVAPFPTVRSDSELEAFFRGNRYIDVISALAGRFIEGAVERETRVNAKFGAASRMFNWIVSSAFLGIASLIVYVFSEFLR
jgi:hypothetical protein